ncbi:hypothetical protein [Bradyrhizobium sp. WYCCWR 12699]|uniref:hypothetical protein n=2 Tax=unclassified Bradyrhizobium TaxID=2631580 RepID=UPI0039185394
MAPAQPRLARSRGALITGLIVGVMRTLLSKGANWFGFCYVELFCNMPLLVLARGAYFHPKHNMSLCAVHTETDIAAALEAAEHGLATVAAL